MAKVVTAAKRYELKEVGHSIKDKSSEEKSLLKTKEFAKIKHLKNFSQKGIDVEIISGPEEERGLLKVSVKAFRNGQEIVLDNPLYYKNPPIMVPDGTYHLDPLHGGEVFNYKEDLEEALKEIIIQTVEVTGK